MSKGIDESSISRTIIRSKDSILKWVDDTSGTVFVPEGRKYGDGYIYSGILDRESGERLDKNKVVGTLSEYLDLLDKHGRKYEYYHITKKDEHYLIPSHGYTIAKFVKRHFPEKYDEMSRPSKVQFNTRKWDFRVWSKTDHMKKERKFFEIPNEIGKILIGRKGCVGKDFYSKTNCSFSIKYNPRSRRSCLVLYADKSVMEKASEIISSMISSAKEEGKVCDIPNICFPSLSLMG